MMTFIELAAGWVMVLVITYAALMAVTAGNGSRAGGGDVW